MLVEATCPPKVDSVSSFRLGLGRFLSAGAGHSSA